MGSKLTIDQGKFMEQQEAKGNLESTGGGGWVEKVSMETSSVGRQRRRRRLHSREQRE